MLWVCFDLRSSTRELPAPQLFYSLFQCKPSGAGRKVPIVQLWDPLETVVCIWNNIRTQQMHGLMYREIALRPDHFSTYRETTIYIASLQSLFDYIALHLALWQLYVADDLFVVCCQSVLPPFVCSRYLLILSWLRANLDQACNSSGAFSLAFKMWCDLYSFCVWPFKEFIYTIVKRKLFPYWEKRKRKKKHIL